MLALIPILGPIIQGILVPLFGSIVSIFTKAQDVKLETYKTDADVFKTTTKASTDTLTIFKDDWGVRLCRDIIMLPGSIWCGLYLWDKIVAFHYPALVWSVASLDGPLAGMPYTLMAFFFGVAAMNIWKFR